MFIHRRWAAKGEIVAARVPSLAMPAPERFLGGHPMAGKDTRGIEAGRRLETLPRSAWLLTPLDSFPG